MDILRVLAAPKFVHLEARCVHVQGATLGTTRCGLRQSLAVCASNKASRGSGFVIILAGSYDYLSLITLVG